MTDEEFSALPSAERIDQGRGSSLTTFLPLPNDPQSEAELLSVFMLPETGPESYTLALSLGITESSFFIVSHRIIWRALTSLAREKSESFEVFAVYSALKQSGDLSPSLDLAALTVIQALVPTSLYSKKIITHVRDVEIRRILAALGDRLTTASRNGVTTEELRIAVSDVVPHLDASRSSRGSAFTVWTPLSFREYTPPQNLNLLGSGYIRRRQLTTLIGPPGVGKSRLSLWMACCHIAGRTMFDLEPSNYPAKWLFFGNENDPLRQKTDLEWFYRNLTAVEQVSVDSNLFLHVLDQPDDGIITLADPDAYIKLVLTLKKVQPDVIVFDPWGNMIEGNENDNEEVRRTLKALLRAVSSSSPNAAIIVIHHARTGKATALEAGNNFSGGSLGRGSKALVSSARCELALWPGHSEDSSRLVLTCEKVNNVKKFEPKGILFENGVYTSDPNFSLDGWRDDIEGERGGKTLTIADLVSAVKEGNHKVKDITTFCSENFGASRASVYRRLNDAAEKGWIVKTHPPGSYTLGEKVHQAPSA